MDPCPRFANQLEIGFVQIGKVLSFSTLSYVTYEGVHLLETLELAHREQRADLWSFQRRLHLVVTALREGSIQSSFVTSWTGPFLTGGLPEFH